LVSDHLSGTLDSATTAVKMIPDFPITVVDSRSASMGQGFIALAAARAADEGKDHTEVAEVVRRLVPVMRVVFVVDTLEYLHRVGRIGGAQNLWLLDAPSARLWAGRWKSLRRTRPARARSMRPSCTLPNQTRPTSF
jgi:hypothetical protein